MNNKKLYISLAVLVIVVAAVVGIVVAQSGHKSSTSSMAGMDMSSSAPVAANQVTIQNYMFTPANITVKVGTTVTWTNQDAVGHTVTADTNSTDAPSSMDIEQGKSFSFTFKKAGTYTYHCTPHPYMHGTVKVTE